MEYLTYKSLSKIITWVSKSFHSELLKLCFSYQSTYNLFQNSILRQKISFHNFWGSEFKHSFDLWLRVCHESVVRVCTRTIGLHCKIIHFPSSNMCLLTFSSSWAEHPSSLLAIGQKLTSVLCHISICIWYLTTQSALAIWAWEKSLRTFQIHGFGLL